MTVNKTIEALKHIYANVTKGKWWMDSHGEAMVAFGNEQMAVRTVFKPEHLRDKPHRDENTGGLSYWPNDSDASWIACAQPENIMPIIRGYEQSKFDLDIKDDIIRTSESLLKESEAKRLAVESELENLRSMIKPVYQLYADGGWQDVKEQRYETNSRIHHTVQYPARVLYWINKGDS